VEVEVLPPAESLSTVKGRLQRALNFGVPLFGPPKEDPTTPK
jgi:hypothetical protein